MYFIFPIQTLPCLHPRPGLQLHFLPGLQGDHHPCACCAKAEEKGEPFYSKEKHVEETELCCTKKYLKKKKTCLEAKNWLGSPSQKMNSFKCNLCDQSFRTSNGVNIHKGKAYKESGLSPNEKLYDNPDEPLSLNRVYKKRGLS